MPVAPYLNLGGIGFDGTTRWPRSGEFCNAEKLSAGLVECYVSDGPGVWLGGWSVLVGGWSVLVGAIARLKRSKTFALAPMSLLSKHEDECRL